MKHSELFLTMLEECDVEGVRRLWQHAMPTMPQPETSGAALVAIHIARTSIDGIALNARAYSHAWLRERALPSNLPDALRASAERTYPVTVGCVGISCNAVSSEPVRRAIVGHVQGAMETRVKELYAEDTTDPVIVKREMFDARAKTYKRMLGSLAMPPADAKL